MLYIVKTGAHSFMDGSNRKLFDKNEFEFTEECPSVVVSFPSQVVCKECKSVESPEACGVGPK